MMYNKNSMKIPLRYQNTEYDCGTTSFINALAYLYDREDIPVELLKAIYDFTLDVKGEDGVVGEGGTSREKAKELADFFVECANKDAQFDISCEVLSGEEVELGKMRRVLDEGGVIIARCWHEGEHYVLITKIDDNFAYIFDPYYFEKEHYVDDEDVEMVFTKSLRIIDWLRFNVCLAKLKKTFRCLRKTSARLF